MGNRSLLLLFSLSRSALSACALAAWYFRPPRAVLVEPAVFDLGECEQGTTLLILRKPGTTSGACRFAALTVGMALAGLTGPAIWPATAFADQNSLQQVLQMDEATLQARKSITECELELATRVETLTDKERPVVRSDSTFLVSGRKTLFARYYRDSNPPTRMVWCRNCQADGYVFHFQDGGQDTPTAARFQPLKSAGGKSADQFIPDPRLLGLVHDFGSRPHTSPDDFLGRADRRDMHVAHEQIDGTDCVRVQFRASENHIVTYWTAPALGNSVVLLENQFEGRIIRTVSRPVRHEPSGIWFPVFVESTTTRGSTVERKQTTQVSVKSLNQSIDQSRFALAAIGLRSGTEVFGVPPGDQDKKWTGSELVDSQSMPPPSGSAWSARRGSEWYLRGAILLAAVAVVVALALLRRRVMRSPG